MKIAVYAICKNEEKFAARWMSSMKEADEIFVLDTGSTDNTVSVLRSLGAKVAVREVTPWRFDTARNLSLEMVSGDADICVCTDLDEVFAAGWRRALEAVWQPGVTTQVRYPYTWSFHEDGTPAVSFYIEKIHARHGFRWHHPVHEVLQYTGNGAQHFAVADGVQLNHYPDHMKSRAQYLPLLELSVKEAPEDDRNMHYLGREYMFYERWDDCIETLKRHLALKSAVWLDERVASMRYIARAYSAKGMVQEAEQWLLRAIAEAPYLREGWMESAMQAYRRQNWEGVYYFASQALKITEKPVSYISEAFCSEGTVLDLLSLAAYHLGLYKKALTLSEKACDAAPQDERIRNNCTFFRKTLENLPNL